MWVLSVLGAAHKALRSFRPGKVFWKHKLENEFLLDSFFVPFEFEPGGYNSIQNSLIFRWYDIFLALKILKESAKRKRVLLKCVNGGGDVIIFQLKMERINEMGKGGWC